MGKPISYDYRCLIVKKKKAGQTFSSISEELGYSESGVKKIWYAYQKEGEAGLKLKYHNCGRRIIYGDSVRKKVNKLRTGDQGASYVHSQYQLKYPEEQAPSISIIQRMWQKEKTNRPKGRPTNREKKVGQHKHSIESK